MEKKKRSIDYVWEYLLISAGTLLISLGAFFFMIPGKLILGSVTGLSTVLAHFLPMEIAVINLILNMLLLVLGLVFVGKDFGIKTVYTAVLMPVFLYILERGFPNTQSLTGDMLTDTICCVMLAGAGQAILFNLNASSGGLDILAKMMNKFLHIELGNALAFLGMAVVMSSILVYDSRAVVTGVVGTYFNGIAVDFFISGFTRKKKVCIISDKYEEIRKFLIRDINRGVTLYTAVGGYEKTERTELVTILDKGEYGKLMKFVDEVDDKAFVTVSGVSEVVGTWNKSRR